jgi:hypothetical protein
MMIRICKHYIPWNLAFLVVAENVIIFASVYAGAIIKPFLDFHHVPTELDYVYLKALIISIATTITFYIVDLYDSELHTRRNEFLLKISICFTIIFFIIISINILVPSLQLHGIDYFMSLIVFAPVIICFRLIYYKTLNLRKENVIILSYLIGIIMDSKYKVLLLKVLYVLTKY